MDPPNDAEEKLEERKKKVLSNLKFNKNWLIYVALIIILISAFYIRTLFINNLKDPTTGDYVSMELDSEIWLKYAKIIAEQGKLPEKDMMRFYPDGLDLTTYPTFPSYFVAYLYKFLKIFSPNMTVALADILYPAFATVITLLFMFFLLRRLFDWRVALLSILITNVSTAFLFRSISSDHDILGMMFLMMTFYFIVVGWQSKSTNKALFFGFLASITTALGKWTAGIILFAFLVTGFFILLEIFLNKFDKRDYYVLIGWLVPFSIYALMFPKLGGLNSYLTSVTTNAAYLALLTATIDYFLFKKNVFKIKDKLADKFPEGAVSFVAAVFLGILYRIVQQGLGFFKWVIDEISGMLFIGLGGSRWALTVAESRKSYVADWFSNFGSLYVYLFIIGSMILFYHAFKNIAKAKRFLGLYIIFIIPYIFSRYSEGHKVLNGVSPTAKFLLIGSLVVFIFTSIFFYFRFFYKNKEYYNQLTKIDKKYFFMLIWFLGGIIASTSAIRLLFEFVPVTAILVAYFGVAVYDYINKIKNLYIKIALIVVLALIFFNPFATAQGIVVKNYNSSKNQAKYIGPGYNARWMQAGEWTRENTPKDAVFAHWWDYGYWVQRGFERATLTDGGNLGGYALNYNMGRHVLTGRNETEALEFLKAKGANYLLIISDEIGKYTAFSLIGSDITFDRYSWINPFSLDLSQTQETRNQTLYAYIGGSQLDENLILGDLVIPAGSAGVGGFLVPLEQRNDTIEVGQPVALIVYAGKQYNLPINCVFLSAYNKKIEFRDGYDACLEIIPRVDGDKMNSIGGALYLSRKVKNTMFTKLYLFNEESMYFKLVYSDKNNVPLMIFNGQLVGPLNIWQISYPDNLNIPEHYYTNTLEDPRVVEVRR